MSVQFSDRSGRRLTSLWLLLICHRITASTPRHYQTIVKVLASHL
ncbi:hypothetical protein [Trichodesmium erythraeum]|nr:hypothetical protein [Trichodesmium sp. St11_bin5]